jgi:hypothetical protein
MKMSTYDCQPTLTDSQVLDFCKTGTLMLEGVVPDEINRRTVEWLDELHESGKGRVQAGELLRKDWFVENVVRNPQAAGAMRSLLGAEYHEPQWLSFFRGDQPSPPGQWHIDAGSPHGPQINLVKWFYLPAEATVPLGPTEFVVGSHHVLNQVRFMAHYDGIRGCWKAVGPPGSIYLTAYQLWHRRGVCTENRIRYMVTSSAHRTSAPMRDWIQEPEFDFAMADYQLQSPRFGEQFRSSVDSARMFCWLCGNIDAFQTTDGPGWPMPRTTPEPWFDVPKEIAGLGARLGEAPPTYRT